MPQEILLLSAKFRVSGGASIRVIMSMVLGMPALFESLVSLRPYAHE